jgi:hypothetical protein
LAAVKNSAKTFTRLFILQCIMLSLLFFGATEGFLNRPTEYMLIYISISLMLLWLLLYFFMTFYLGKNHLIEYDLGIYKDFINIPVTFYRQMKNRKLRYFIYAYIVVFAALVVMSIVLFVTSK